MEFGIEKCFLQGKQGNEQLVLRRTELPSGCQEKALFFFLFFFFVFLGLNLWHMEIPRLGIKSELQLLAYTTATAMQDLRCVCDLHHSSQQCWVLNPLSEARDQTCILTDTSGFCYC